jgi:hypothetical protein
MPSHKRFLSRLKHETRDAIEYQMPVLYPSTIPTLLFFGRHDNAERAALLMSRSERRRRLPPIHSAITCEVSHPLFVGMKRLESRLETARLYSVTGNTLRVECKECLCI